jgi:hypothetical protein
MRLNEKGPPICWPCFNAYKQNLNQSTVYAIAMANHLMDEMAFKAGLPPIGPRIRVPQPLTMNTTNNIKVEAGSQVGQINAGTLNYLDHCVTVLKTGNAKEVAAALQEFTQSVVDSRELSAESQKQVLDYLQALMEEVTKGEKRNASLFRLLLQNIGTLVNVGTTIAAHWDKLKQIFDTFAT